jgi:serine-aspartate repeat-containing protein C/D/E
MKAVRPVALASAIVFCSLALAAQTAHDAARVSPAGHPSSDATPRLVGWHSDAAPSAAAATTPPISGSIATFGASGPQQVFTSKSAVSFAVGSTATPCQSFAYLPDGTYVFQVTNRTGTTLLSTDPASERTITVKNGVISSYGGTTHAVGSRTACGSLTIGLAPFNDAGSRDAGYVLWLTPLASFEGQPSQVDVVCGTGCFHGFRPESSRAIFFRVEDKPNCPATFCVSGVKFEDRNGNGIQDAGEPPLAGVEIRVTGDSGVVFSTLTAPDGSFQICGLALGEGYKITEVVPFGYAQTGPPDGTVAHRVFTRGGAYFIEVCEGDLSGLAFGNQLLPNAIGGVKYEDLNANGRRDPGEPGLPGVTIRLTPAAGGSAQTATTDANGNFLFTSISPGNYVLTEVVPSGFTQTEPASANGAINVTLASGGSSINNTFGNFRGVLTGTISGVKFLDVNGNGVRDPGEPGRSGVSFVLMPCPSPCVPPPVATAVSGSDGTFSFTGIPFGTYFLSESLPAGFKQTVPATKEVQVSLSVGQPSVTGLIFGNQAVGASISGTKFNDANGNGVRDPGEAGMSGITIRLTPSSGAALTATTDASGNFSFTGLSPGTYVLSEAVPPGFVQTAPPPPGTATFTVVAGQAVTGVLVGNLAAPSAGSISGTKYLDLNANGVLDAGDRGYPGIVIVLTDAMGVQRQATSDASGNFSFTNLPPGSYTLTEIIPPGFAQTLPGTPDHPTGYTITLAPGQNATGFIFLNKC